MSKDYCWKNTKLADILMTLAAIPNVDVLSDETLTEFKDELMRTDALVEDLGNALIEALDENEDEETTSVAKVKELSMIGEDKVLFFVSHFRKAGYIE